MTPSPLVQERIVCRQTTLSVITDCLPSGDGSSTRPVLLLLHGANRIGLVFLEGLAPYREWADVLVPDLPGSGRSEPALEAGIAPLADEIVSLVRRRLPDRTVVIVGESAGALVGLACSDGRLPVAGLVMLDPPLSMAKQWMIQADITNTCRQTGNWFPRAAADRVFGIDCATGRIEERLYYDGFTDLVAPCLILRGDTPLFPVRAPDRVPNCFDDVDELVVRLINPACRIQCLSECGHLVFHDGGLRCHDLIRGFVAGVVHV